MKTARDVIIRGLTLSGGMLETFCADLTPEEFQYRPVPKANCVAWIIGHLILSDRSATKLLAPQNAIPLPEGFAERFARTEEAAAAETFGDTTQLLPLFRTGRAALIEAVQGCDDAVLEMPVERPTPMFSTAAELVAFFAQHTAMHVGQITTIRRALGRPPIR